MQSYLLAKDIASLTKSMIDGFVENKNPVFSNNSIILMQEV